ncbi:thiamine phosphate synthase [Parvularcula sp. ZS-1/3]|uniref:Thiamine-phosphate synthase n=1 Tax=Parvularcula mediterranea TaxID=2732508 RepID=A0A7Y3W4R9_9PROT|nr:thiamine phosphate synthase [Parvularcula mediterranea]NNU16040.1 thiamine phosphate synthase [Parvularcula mediterranea]
MTTDPLLYLITPPKIDDLLGFAEALGAVMGETAGTTAGIACLQLRLKEVSDDEILRAAEAVAPLCEQFGAGFLINDRADLAKKAGADGVHIGQSDGTLAEARSILGAGKDIGVTCHDSIHLAMEAGEAGADYVAFGAFYPSSTKEGAFRPEPEILTRWTEMATVPCVAIGGITAETARPLAEAGADYLAVSGAIWAHAEGPIEGAKAFKKALAAQ